MMEMRSVPTNKCGTLLKFVATTSTRRACPKRSKNQASMVGGRKVPMRATTWPSCRHCSRLILADQRILSQQTHTYHPRTRPRPDDLRV